MKNREQIESKLDDIQTLIATMYRDLDNIKDKEEYKTYFQELLVYLGQEKILKWALTFEN